MAHRHIYNTPQIFEAESDQQWNHLQAEYPYMHFARTGATESGNLFHPGENGLVDGVHFSSQWNSAPRLNGYSSSNQGVNGPHYQTDGPDPPRDTAHPPAVGNVFMVPENHLHHSSSSSTYGVESNLFDLSMSNTRRPYKRKSPGSPPIAERGSSSRYYCPGSSSDMSSSPELRPEKSNVDAPHTHWEPLTLPPSYRVNQFSIGSEDTLRNVRSRHALDLESEVFRTHMPVNFSHHPPTNRLPNDQPSTVDHPNQNLSVPLPEWNPVVLGSLPHEVNHFFAGNSVNASCEMTGYHHEPITSRNPVPQALHSTPSHTRGVRSSYTHRSNPSHRVSLGNMCMGHVGPSDEGPQLVAESHSSRHPSRPFGSMGWRNGDRSGRSRLAAERYRLLSEDAGSHDRMTPEGLVIVERSSLFGSRNLLDQHRDMRLDVDNMSYEELLALGERIGSVSTGLCEDKLPKCLIETVYCSSDQEQEQGRCVICLEEYEHMDDVGMLKGCRHDYHVSCIKKWLSMKNLCPICKGPALPDNPREK